MSEEILSGNQTTPETPEVNEAPIQQESTPTEPQEPSTPPQENVFTVKYNKEEVKVPYEQAPDYIQKGMNYDKVSQRAEEYQQNLDRVARLTGYESHDAMMKALDTFEKEQERQDLIQRGLDPDALEDVVNKRIESHPDIQYAREMKQQQEEQQRFQEEANELFSEFPDLKPEQIPAEVWQLKEQKGIPLLDAYNRVNIKNLRTQAEQEAIQKLQQNAQSTPGSLGAGAEHQPISVKSMSKADFESMIQRVKRGERVDL